MQFLGIFCLLFGALQWGVLIWHYRLDLDALLANWALWGTLILASMLIVSGISFLLRPWLMAVRLFALACSFYLLGMYAEMLPAFQAQLMQKFGMAAQIIVVVGGLLVLRISYALISRPMLKRVAALQREGKFVKEVSKQTDAS